MPLRIATTAWPSSCSRIERKNTSADTTASANAFVSSPGNRSLVVARQRPDDQEQDEEPADVHADPDSEDPGQLDGVRLRTLRGMVGVGRAQFGNLGLMARKWWTLLAACLATFMLLLDVTVVNVALPDIRHELGGSSPTCSGWWMPTRSAWPRCCWPRARSPTCSGGGSSSSTGIVVFVVSSFVCGLADSPTILNISRAVQGLGGAMMFATSLALIAQEFAPNERGTAIGLWGATTGFAVAVGPVVGGVITEHLGWEWIFFVNVPVGLATLAMTLTQVPEGERDTSAAHRLGRPGDLQRRAVLPRAGADPRQRRGLGQRPDRGSAGGERAADGGVRGGRAAHRSGRCSTCTCSASRLSPARRSRRSRCTRRCSRCSSTS